MTLRILLVATVVVLSFACSKHKQQPQQNTNSATRPPRTVVSPLVPLDEPKGLPERFDIKWSGEMGLPTTLQVLILKNPERQTRSYLAGYNAQDFVLHGLIRFNEARELPEDKMALGVFLPELAGLSIDVTVKNYADQMIGNLFGAMDHDGLGGLKVEPNNVQFSPYEPREGLTTVIVVRAHYFAIEPPATEGTAEITVRWKGKVFKTGFLPFQVR
jgi:hypothetical protein